MLDVSFVANEAYAKAFKVFPVKLIERQILLSCLDRWRDR